MSLLNHAIDPSLSAIAHLVSPKHEQPSRQLASNQSTSAEPLDFDTLLKHGVTMLALDNDWLEGDLKSKAQASKREFIAHEMIVKHSLLETFEQLDDHLPNCWLIIKGTALAYIHYQQAWLRPRTDVDIFIDFENYGLAEKALCQAGFEKLHAIEGSLINHQVSFSKKLAKHKSLTIDLHWRLSNRHSLAQCYSAGELRNEAIQVTKLSRVAYTPNHIDALLIACIHRTGHHRKDDRLMWLYDIHLLASELDSTHWPTVYQKAHDKKIKAICADALQVCKILFNTPVPNDVLQKLCDPKAQHERSARLLENHSEWRYQLVDIGALTCLNRLRYLHQNLVPTRDYMRTQFPDTPFPLSYLLRLIRGIKRLLS